MEGGTYGRHGMTDMAEVQSIMKEVKEGKVRSGRITWISFLENGGQKYLLFVPKYIRNIFLHHFHDNLLSGHLGLKDPPEGVGSGV